MATSGGDQFTVKLWDVKTKQLLRTLHSAGTSGLNADSMAISSDDRILVAADDVGGQINTWNLSTGRLLRTIKNDLPVFSTALSPDSGIPSLCSMDTPSSSGI